MDEKLSKLFDYQRFEQNPRLKKLIDEAEASSERKLTDEELSEVAAAGSRGSRTAKRKKKT